MRFVPTRSQALTKVKVKVKHMVGTTTEESQHVDRFGRRQPWASPSMGVAKYGRRQVWASPSMGVTRFWRRQVWASPILKARPIILKVCFGSDGDTLRYPRVGKTVEGASQQEATVRTRRPRAPVPRTITREKRKVASRPYPQYQ